MLIGGNPLRYEEIVWVDNIPVGRVESSTSAVTAVHAIHSDHLNTPRALANAQTQGGQAAGTVVWRWELNATSASGSNAFGTQAAEENPDGNSATVKFDLRFPGQQYDAATGVNYNYFRDYEAGTGRYVESDPAGLWGGLGLYVYANARPMSSFDRTGLWPDGGTPMDRPCGAVPGRGCSPIPPNTPPNPLDTPDTSVCSYYDRVCSERGCNYHCYLAPLVCRNADYLHYGMVTRGRNLNCVRKCLVIEDEHSLPGVNKACERGRCNTGKQIDEYHSKCFIECGVPEWTYPGVDWIPGIGK